MRVSVQRLLGTFSRRKVPQNFTRKDVDIIAYFLILDIFHQKHNVLMPVTKNKKKLNGHETGVFGEKKIKNSAQIKHRQYSLFLIFDIFHQKHNFLMPVKKKTNRHETGVFWRKKSKKVQKKDIDQIIQFIFDFGHISSKTHRSHACFFFHTKFKWA